MDETLKQLLAEIFRLNLELDRLNKVVERLDAENELLKKQVAGIEPATRGGA